MKFVIIGGNAAGMSAASRVKRKAPDSQVIVLEQTKEVSYAACGLPYYVSGLNNNIDLMRIRSVGAFEESGIAVKLGSKVQRVDFERHIVYYQDKAGDTQTESYDKLLISSGSLPKTPPIPGISKRGIFQLKTLVDAQKLKDALIGAPKNVVIVGGGYIGLEMAEACLLHNVSSLRIVEAADRLLNVFDPEFSAAVQQELENHGVCIDTGERILSFQGNKHVTHVVTDRGTYPADLVILCIGISPNTGFFGTSLEKFPNGAILTNPAMETSVPNVYAAGDCATVWSRLLNKPVYIALGTYANKQGRLAGDSMLGKQVCFQRALGTSMLRCMGLELAKTGLGEIECRQHNIPYQCQTVQTRSHARYFPDPSMLTIKLCYRPGQHVLLGAQIMGAKEAACRIDTLACAIDQGMTTEELGFLDLGYAPPFASVWDAIQIAANASK